MPVTLLHALDALAKDDVVTRSLGEVPGGTYADYYADVKSTEFNDYHSTVGKWELDRYLTLF